MDKRKIIYILALVGSNILVGLIVLLGTRHQYNLKMNSLTAEYDKSRYVLEERITNYEKEVEDYKQQINTYNAEIVNNSSSKPETDQEEIVPTPTPTPVVESEKKKKDSTKKDSASDQKAKKGMIFQDSDSRFLSVDELEKISKEECRIARNELFARHGYQFMDEKLRKHFESLSWYKADPNTDAYTIQDNFNNYEQENLQLILSYEYEHYE